MKSGLYIVTLNNEHPISVNAHDPRLANKSIKVTKRNCKFGKAKNLEGRRKNYYKTFGEQNVNYRPVALVEDIATAEKVVLASLNDYRIRSPSGRKNEWLEGIEAAAVVALAIAELDRAGIPYEPLTQPGRVEGERPATIKAGKTFRARKSSAPYSGNYRIVRQPGRLKPHNEATWRKLLSCIQDNSGTASFDKLAQAAQGHLHGGENANNPAGFVSYCINSGWLDPVD